MKKILFITLFFFLTANAFALVRGGGRFASQAGDSGTFIKKQLKYQAFKDIITQELSSMNLNPQNFWQQHYNQFEDSFQPVRQKLKEQFEQKKLSAKEYQAALRTQRLAAMARYSNLNRLIKSYSEKSMTRSPGAPRVRYLEIDATLDRQALAQLYLKTVRNKQRSRNYRKVYLSAEFQLRGDNWSEVGVNAKSDFTETLKFHWKKWFAKNYPEMKDVMLVEGTSWEHLKNHLRAPHFEAKAGHYANSNAVPPREFEDALWILIKIYLKKTEESPHTKKRTFRIEGNIIMIDLANRHIVANHDFAPFKREYSYSNRRKLSSSLATLIWKLPLETFKSKPARSSLNLKRLGLVIRELGSIRELLQVKKLLSGRGVGMVFTPSIAIYSGRYGIIELAYQGDTDKALEILRSLDKANLDQEKQLIAITPFSFVVKPL